MYEIHCETCGTVGLNESRQGAESKAESHAHKTGHETEITVAQPPGR